VGNYQKPKSDLALTIVIKPDLSGTQIPLHQNTVIKVKVSLFTVVSAGLSYTFYHSHHDGSPRRSIRERVIALVEKGGLSASTAGEPYGIAMYTAREWLRKYRRDGQVGRRKGTGLWRVSSQAQDAAFVAEAERNPFFSAKDLKAATGFPGQMDAIISRLNEAGLRARHAAVKELLTDEHKLYRLAFAESNVDRKWDSHIH
jgi:transposase